MGFRNPVVSLRADQIAPGALPAGVLLPDGSVTPATIALGAVTADGLAAGAVTAAKIDATAIDGKVITGAIVRTAATGQRIALDTQGLVAYNAANTAVTAISAATGALTATGATISAARFVTSSGSGRRIEIAGAAFGFPDQIVAYSAGGSPLVVIDYTGIAVGTGTAAITIAPTGITSSTLSIAATVGNLTLEAGTALGGLVKSATILGNTGAVGTFSGPVMIEAGGGLGRLTGAFAAGHIPALDAAKIATGTLDVARIPFVSGGASFVRLYTGTDDSVGYNVRVTSTPNVGFYDGTTALAYVTSSGNWVVPGVYANVASTRAVYVTSAGTFGTTSSLRAHKCAVDDVDVDVVDALLELRPVTFLRVADLDGPSEPRREVGLIAEEAVAAGMPTEFLYLSDDGALEGVAYERLPVYLVTAFQHLHARIAQLEGAA